MNLTLLSLSIKVFEFEFEFSHTHVCQEFTDSEREREREREREIGKSIIRHLSFHVTFGVSSADGAKWLAERPAPPPRLQPIAT